MKWIAVTLITAVLLSMACKTDYDIEEVATPQHLGTDYHEDCDECEPEDADQTHEEHEHETDIADPGSVYEETDELDVLETSGSDRHVHEEGERNHGTGWFFNQPWAASFIWGKMFRDIIILLLLSAAILLVSGYRRKRQ
ncbi:MAG: hypothetical protein KAR44_01270 [Candidatus Aegiribacteria sp.]|nr:hypothetical protein [Candidatus Aegiribacteria sp.]